jgi:hypothetical protein
VRQPPPCWSVIIAVSRLGPVCAARRLSGTPLSLAQQLVDQLGTRNPAGQTPRATRHAHITNRSLAFDNVDVAHARSVGPRAPARITSVPVLVPGAIVPVALVAGFTVIPVVVMAAALVPVAAPPWIPPLAGAPVIIRERRGLGLGDGGRPQNPRALNPRS